MLGSSCLLHPQNHSSSYRILDARRPHSRRFLPTVRSRGVGYSTRTSLRPGTIWASMQSIKMESVSRQISVILKGRSSLQRTSVLASQARVSRGRSLLASPLRTPFICRISPDVQRRTIIHSDLELNVGAYLGSTTNRPTLARWATFPRPLFSLLSRTMALFRV